MSITVSFTTSSKKINSTKQLTMSDTYECNFKNGCSMLKPTLFLELNSSTFPNYTQFKIENRYYNITDIRTVRNNLFEIDGEVDVLASFKTEIGASTQYVIRSSNTFNEYVMDTKYPAVADTDLVTKFFDNLAPDTEGSYVVGIVGIGESQSAVKYYAFPAFFFSRLLLALFDEGNLDPTMFFPLEIQKELFNPFQYIVSCYWYPIPYSFFEFTTYAEIVHFGWWEAKYSIEGEIYTLSGARIPEAKRVYQFSDTFTPPKHPQAATRGKYLNDIPYTRYSINCYSFGTIPLNPSPFVDGDTGTINISVDVYTGIANLYVSAQGQTASGRLVNQTTQFGVPIQINQNTANVVGGTVSAIETGVDIAAGNVLGAAKGIESCIRSAFPQVQTNGTNGSKVAFLQLANIVGEFRSIVDEYNEDIGRPLCAPRQISTIPGYIECNNVEIDIAATSFEKEQITTFMENGFFYE